MLANAFQQRTIMGSPFVQYDDLVTLASDGGYNLTPALSQLSAVFLLSACEYLYSRWLWQSPIDPISDIQYDEIVSMIQGAQAELMSNYQLGSILSTICVKTDPNLLLMDGQSIAQADYPELANCVPSTWLSGANIILPDMSYRGLFGAIDAMSLGTFVGENSHTLTIDEIPEHTHVQNAHSHNYSQAISTPTAAGLEPALASLVNNTPATTSPTVAINQNTGGSQSHNNIQNSLLVYHYIVAQ